MYQDWTETTFRKNWFSLKSKRKLTWKYNQEVMNIMILNQIETLKKLFGFWNWGISDIEFVFYQRKGRFLCLVILEIWKTPTYSNWNFKKR